MKKLTIEYVKAEIEKVEGYKLITERYVNARTNLKIRCPEGHIFKMMLYNWNTGQRCSICNNQQRLKYKDVKEGVEKIKGYKLLSEEYVNNHTKMEMICPEGHFFEATWGHFKQGYRCGVCFGTSKLTIEYVKGEIEKVEGYKLLSKEYVNNHTKMEIQCPEGHIFKMIWNCWHRGQRCPECNYENGSSKGEKEVLEYIQSITDTTIISNDRTQILNPKTGYNLELDVLLPDLMKAIEYNGTYWHSSDEAIYNDNQKVIQCKEKGIDFMVIEEENWTKNKDEVKNNIKLWIGV